MSKKDRINQFELELWNDFENNEGTPTMHGFYISTTYRFPNDKKHFRLLVDECVKDMKGMHEWQLPTKITYHRSFGSSFTIVFEDRGGFWRAAYRCDEDGNISKSWPAAHVNKKYGGVY